MTNIVALEKPKIYMMGTFSTRHNEYSLVSNKRGGWNSQGGWKKCQNLIAGGVGKNWDCVSFELPDIPFL